MLQFVVSYVLACRKVMVVCEETPRLADPQMDIVEKKTALRSIEGCVGCEDGWWRGSLLRCMKIHALGHFVLHACNCGKMFHSVDSLRKHCVRC